jgi:hypothetical protein
VGIDAPHELVAGSELEVPEVIDPKVSDTPAAGASEQLHTRLMLHRMGAACRIYSSDEAGRANKKAKTSLARVARFGPCAIHLELSVGVKHAGHCDTDEHVGLG